MSGQHTPEPWKVSGRSIKQDYSQIGLGDDAGQTIGCVMGGNTSGPHFVESDVECEANARRIVACVNACAGIPTDSIEGMEVGHLDSIHRQRDELLYVVKDLPSGDELREAARYLESVVKQRDELMAFAEEVRRSGDTRLASMAIAAIARVKGGAA